MTMMFMMRRKRINDPFVVGWVVSLLFTMVFQLLMIGSLVTGFTIYHQTSVLPSAGKRNIISSKCPRQRQQQQLLLLRREGRQQRRRLPVRLYGITEWRDTWFDFPGTGDDRRIGTEVGGPPKEICILPFPYEEVLLQGQTKQLRLYEDRFIKLFDKCMEKHSGLVAMGLIAQSGVIQTVPLCEVEAYNRMEEFGIFVTIRVVGRAQLVDIVQQEPYLTAVCEEMTDKIPPNLDLPNMMADTIENMLLLISSMEHRLADAESQVDKDKLIENESERDAEIRRRTMAAKLEDRYYDDVEDDEDDDSGDDDEDDTDESADVVGLDRRGRFTQAYEVALSTDTQGYYISNDTSEKKTDRSPQELTALSWAAFCTDLFQEADATYRLQALDSSDLFDRLKLAANMLRSKKEQLRQRLNRAGLNVKGEDPDEAL